MSPTLVESETISLLEGAEARLDATLREAEKAIGAVTGCFEELARESAGVMTLAGQIICCVEGEGVRSMLPRVQSLGTAAKLFIHERLEATSGILVMVVDETRLLERLAQLTRAQRSIARETQTLSVLTNIEVARLGQLGAGFQYLARQLDEFSQAVATGTKELAAHTEERQSAIVDTKRRLAAGLPKIQKEFARIETDLESALAVAANSQSELARAPEHFQGVVAEISNQIAGVVAAVQSHDITRQQLEHVRDGLKEIQLRMRAASEAEDAPADPLISAGLIIQIYQLRSIEQTVASWLAQIGSCADNILRISTSEVMGIGPAVLRQEQELSAQLTRIERLEEECEADSAEVQSTFAGLSNLMQLVGEHVERSHTVRDRLQLLTFNSIVEASHLGTQADAILEISQSIKRISIDWSELTDRSAQAKDEILLLVEQTQGSMQTFSESGTEGLRAAQAETRNGLQMLHSAAQCAVGQAAQVNASTMKLQDRIAAVSAARLRLEASFASIGAVHQTLEEARQQAPLFAPGAMARSDARAAESFFAAPYTTELEREVLRAALSGGPLPAADQNLGGNDVELF